MLVKREYSVCFMWRVFLELNLIVRLDNAVQGFTWVLAQFHIFAEGLRFCCRHVTLISAAYNLSRTLKTAH